MSAGIASLQQHQPVTPEALWRLADEALYESKRGGKSQARIHRRKSAAARC
jgi:PleD family two-component response regulator